jgi:hypothetical protein
MVNDIYIFLNHNHSVFNVETNKTDGRNSVNGTKNLTFFFHENDYKV